MQKDERIIIFLSIAALVAALIWRARSALLGEEVSEAFVTNLTFNQPSFVGAGLANVLPQTIVSQQGAPLDNGSYYSDCGCY